LTRNPHILLLHSKLQYKYRERKMNRIDGYKISQVRSTNLSFPMMEKLFRRFNLCKLLQRAKITKEKGIPIIVLLLCLSLMLFKERRSTTYGLKSIGLAHRKTTMNDFLNNFSYNWRKVLLYVVSVYTRLYKPKEGKYSVLIIDDTSKEKQGKRVEYLSWFYDHSKCVFYRGYQVVIAAWSNLQTCIPIDIMLKTGKHRCKGSKKGDYPPDSHAHQMYRESRKGKTKIALSMIMRALKHNILFTYILWDSWYNNNVAFKYVFEELVPKGMHLVSMVKLGNIKYKLGNERLSIKEICKLSGIWVEIGETGIKCKSTIIEIEDKSSNGETTLGKVKLCLFRFVGQKRKYKALISTNTDLTVEEILAIYTHRWSIEVLIKDLKQYFGFNQAQSSKYIAQLTDLTIKCILYAMLCSLKEAQPDKSMGQLVFDFAREFEDFCLEVFSIYFFKTRLKEFLEYVISKGIDDINELIKVLDKMIDDFLNADIPEDKIVECDIVKTKLIPQQSV